MARSAAPWFRAGNDSWYVTYRGRQVPLAKGKANKAAATRAFHRLLVESGDQAASAKGGAAGAALRVDLLLDLHLDAMKPRWAAATFDRTLRDLASFAALFGHLKARDVKPLHVTRWLAVQAEAKAPPDAPPGRRKRGWGTSSMNRAVASLKGAFSWGVREGHLPADPIKAVAKPEMRVRREVLTDAQFAAALAATKDEAFRDLLEVLRRDGVPPRRGGRPGP